MTAASAPGKLFLTGEYAILDGAPALVAAIDRRARVEVDAVDGEGIVIESLAEGTSTVRDPEAGALPGGDGGAVLAALRAAGGRRAAGALRVTVDSRAFLVGERKLGLGRSAATLAAASAALLCADGPVTRDRLLATSLAANALFQDGLGSGADVAASVHGGVVEVRSGHELTAVGRTLPPGLHLVAGWTGRPGPTRPLLTRFAARAARELVALRALKEVASEAAAAVARGDAPGLLEMIRRSAVLLEELGGEAGVPIVTPALARLVEVAGGLGVAAKPSGAGGGDCGIALATSSREAAAVAAAWRREGIEPLALEIASEGATVG